MAKLLSILLAALIIRCIAPLTDASGLCGAQTTFPRMGTDSTLWVHCRWQGPETGEDSVLTIAGHEAQFGFDVIPGIYSVVAWASDKGGQGCPTYITVTLKNPPGPVIFKR